MLNISRPADRLFQNASLLHVRLSLDLTRVLPLKILMQISLFVLLLQLDFTSMYKCACYWNFACFYAYVLNFHSLLIRQSIWIILYFWFVYFFYYFYNIIKYYVWSVLKFHSTLSKIKLQMLLLGRTLSIMTYCGCILVLCRYISA